MKILISADTSCLINQEVLRKNSISIFPLNVIIDGKEYLDGITIDHEFLYQEMKQNKVIKTSTPPLGEVIEYFEKLFEEGYDKIIHFTISSKLSSMYDLFTNVSQTYFDNKVIVIDSYSVSSLMLSHVLYASDEVNKGTPIEKICEEIEKRKEQNYICFIPKNLTALKNGGRISPAIAAIGNTIGLKPVLLLKDGALEKDAMTKNMKKAFIERINNAYQNYPTAEYDYTLVSFEGDQNVINLIHEHINTLAPNCKVIRGIIPINICAHCGPGTIGLLVTPKINNKSINDYL